MDLKFARTDVNAKPKKADLSKIETMVEKEDSVIFYFDRENSHKDYLNFKITLRLKEKVFI